MKDQQIKGVEQPNHMESYFQSEKKSLILISISGTFYNVGMIAGPYFEGQLAQCLFDIMQDRKTPSAMILLTVLYLVVILFVQIMRSIKRFGVRRFANNTSRNMRHMLYNSLVHMHQDDLEKENLGSIMTKAIADVDVCVEGMRKFTTEIFDTGVVLIAYIIMLFSYDWRLALLSCICTPFAYLTASHLKKQVSQSNSAYKKSAEQLNGATMDRISHAITYRIYGCEENKNTAYEACLTDYEKRAVTANLWDNAMQPIYTVISMTGIILILYLGAQNVLGTGWKSWNIAAFTTFLSCFTKMALKSSHAAKLFNSIQKANVSWKRIKPLMKEYVEPDMIYSPVDTMYTGLTFSHVSLRWPDKSPILQNISFTAHPGQIIGVTGPVACGKSTLGKALIGEISYSGSIRISGRELCHLNNIERSQIISYMGHEPELISAELSENIRLGKTGTIEPFLQAVCLDAEIQHMPQGADTLIGNGGIQLSGGQQARLALARTLYNAQHILVLDDPFSAVDRDTETAILKNLTVLMKNKTILLFSHRLYQFPSFDRVLFLCNKKGIFSTHKKLMEENADYAKLYIEQVQGGGGYEN